MESTQYYYGESIKMVSDDTSEGYLVRFTDKEKRDLHKQWFSKRTDFLQDVSPIVGKMVLFNHGMHKSIGTIPIGEITHAEIRDEGIFVKKRDIFKQQFKTYAENRALIQTLKPAKEFLDEFMDELDEYEKMLSDLRESGYFKFSSGALPQSVEWDHETGEILKWQIIDGSETGTPAEPRMLTQIHTSKSFQALGLPYITPATRGIYSFNHTTSNPDGQSIEVEQPKEIQTTAGKSSDRNLSDVSPINEVKMEQETQKPAVDETSKMEGESQEEMILRLIRQELSREKMQDEENTDEEKMSDEEQKSIILEALKQYKIEQQAQEKEQTDLKSLIAETIKAEMKSAPVKYARDEVGTRTSEKTTPKISVAEPEQYRYLSADEMALGVKLAYAKMSPVERKMVKLNDIFTDAYVKSLGHKMQADIQALRELNPRDEIGKIDHADMKHAVKSFTKNNELNASDITNQGDEFATVYYDTRLWDRVRENTELFNRLQSKGMRTVDLPQGSESMDVYLVTSSGTVYTGRQANNTNVVGLPETVVDINAFNTDKVNQPLSKHTLAYGLTYELEERSIINVVQVANQDMAQTLAEALEDALINGDTTLTANNNINLNNGTPATTAFGQTPLYVAWDGLRHAYLVDNTARGDDHGGTALSVEDFEDTIQLFDNAFRTRRNNMLFVIDTKTEASMRKLPELLTRDVAGDRLTMFTGNVPPMFGVDVYTSGFMPRTGTAGTISSTGSGTSPNTLGGISCVYAPFWQYGRQRAITIETDRYAVAQTTVMVASVTHAFRRRGDNSAVGKYNVAVV